MEPLALIASQHVLVDNRRRHKSVMLVSKKYGLWREFEAAAVEVMKDYNLNLQGRFMSDPLVILVLAKPKCFDYILL